MVFERTSQIVNEKLENLELRIPYKLCRTICTETFVDECTRHIVLNPEDRKSKVLAQQTMQHLLLHELGHLFVRRFITRKIKKKPKFILLFGDLTKVYRRKLSRIRTSRDFISNYAQAHPEENFCEVFAVYCAHEGKIRKVYKHLKKAKKSKHVRNQVRWIHKFVKRLKK